MNFCTNCGKEMGNEMFCPNCGAKAPEKTEAPATGGFDVNKIKNMTNGNNAAKAIIIGAAALVVVIILFFVFGTRSANSTAKKAVKAMINGDAKTIVNLMPDKVIKESGMKKKELIEVMEDKMPNMSGLAKGMKMKIVGVEKEELKSAELRELKELYKDEYKINISGAVTAKVKYKATVFGVESTNTLPITLVKIGLKWYVDISDF